MDQIKIGKFISSLRKEKGYTQQDLADKLNVSNKSISRWENGKTMPDLSIIPNLCKVLGISINELFCGERLASDEYQKKFEENIIINMDLLKKKIKKISKILVLTILVMFVLVFGGLLLFICYKEYTYTKVDISDNNIETKVCRFKEYISLELSTKDHTAFLYDLDYNEDKKIYIIDKVYKYIDDNNMKDIVSASSVLLENDIKQIKYKDKIIYSEGDKLKNCD